MGKEEAIVYLNSCSQEPYCTICSCGLFPCFIPKCVPGTMDDFDAGARKVREQHYTPALFELSSCLCHTLVRSRFQ